MDLQLRQWPACPVLSSQLARVMIGREFPEWIYSVGCYFQSQQVESNECLEQVVIVLFSHIGPKNGK